MNEDSKDPDRDSLKPRKAYWSVDPELDLSRFRAAPSARLSHLSFESDGAFPAQC